MVKIIEESCIGCGKCTKICPTNILKIEEKKAVLKEGHICLNCGHCQGICPANAVLIDGQFADEYKVTPNVSYEDLKNLIKTNRSVRRFKDDLVPQEKIEDIIRATDFTGSAKNEQAIKWAVVSSREKVKEVSDLSVDFIKKIGILPEVVRSIETFRNPITVDAPHLLIAYADKNSIFPTVDGVIKLVSAELLMHADGIGSCHLGYLINFVNNSKELKDYLGLEENDMVYGALGFGYYSKEVYPHIPHREKASINFI